jgi:hypothetical protein
MLGLGIFTLLLAAGATFYYVKKFPPKNEREALNDAAAKKAAQLRAKRDKDLSIGNVRAGGVITFTNIGPNLESFDAQITERHLYKSGSDSWYELEGNQDDGRIFVTLAEGEISVSVRQPKLSDLALDQGFGSAEKPPQEVIYNGETYIFEESGAASYCKSCNELEPEHFKYWDFERADESSALSVIEWADGTYEVSESMPVKDHQITVLSNS